jgi:hypothetical protein
MPLLHALAPLLRAVWESLEACTDYALDTLRVRAIPASLYPIEVS